MSEWAELGRSANMDLRDLERFCMEEWSVISCPVFYKLIGIIGEVSEQLFWKKFFLNIFKMSTLFWRFLCSRNEINRLVELRRI